MTRNIGCRIVLGLFIAWAAQATPTHGQTYPTPAAPGAARPASPTYGPAAAQSQQMAPANAVRQVAGEQPIRQPDVAPAAATPFPAEQAPEPRMPPGFPLDPPLQKYVDSILDYWESRSNKIKTYRCDFQRWDYDPVFGPKTEPLTYSTGVIQYASPDKGLFRVDRIQKNVPPAKPGEKGQWIEQKGVYGEHWVCDGTKIFEFDSRNKRLIERALPPEMHGKAIADGPLPFLFGAKAATIKQRYWIRPVTPATAKGEYWLEAHPKSRSDAANFKMVLVVLDEADYLPKQLQVFSPNFDIKENPAKTAYQFNNREVNKVDLLSGLANKLNPFFREFYEPKLPAADWKKEIERLGPAAPPPSDSRPIQATRPAATTQG